MIVDNLRRLFAAISLNRTIREALQQHPESVPLLLGKLEERAPFPLALGGWIFLGLGLLAAILVVQAAPDQDNEALIPAGSVAVLGAVLLLASWWVRRAR